MQFRKQYSIKEIVNINNNLMYLISKLIFKDYMIKRIAMKIKYKLATFLHQWHQTDNLKSNFLEASGPIDIAIEKNFFSLRSTLSQITLTLIK